MDNNKPKTPQDNNPTDAAFLRYLDKIKTQPETTPLEYKAGSLDPDEWSSLEGPYNDYATREELIKRRDDDQSFGEAFGIGLANVLPNVALGIVENVGELGDFKAHYDTVTGKGNDYNNFITEWAKSKKNPFGEIYTAESNDPGEVDWWLKNGFGVLESAGQFAITGAGVGSLAGKTAIGLAKVLDASRKGQTIARIGASTLTNTSLAYAEGFMSGATVYEDAFTEAIKAGKSDLEANDIASRAAAKTVRINTVVNSVLNIPQTASLFRDINYFNALDDVLKRAEGETTEQYLKRLKDLPESKRALASSFSKESLKDKALEMGSESLEEVVNQISEDEGAYQYLRELGKVSDKDILTRLGETLKKDETWSAAFWGAVGGIAQPALINVVPKKVKEYDDQGNVVKEKWTTVGRFNAEQEDKIYRDQVDGLVTHLGAIQDAKKNLAAAAKSGNKEAYKKAQDELFGLESYQSVVKGLSDQAKDSYREIQMLNEEEAANQGFNVNPNSEDYYKHLAARKMNDIDHLTAKYTELNNKYNYDKLDPELYGYHNELFSRYIDIYNNRQRVDNFDKNLVKTEAEYKANRARRGMDFTISTALDIQAANKAVEKEFDAVTRQEESFRKQQESGIPLTASQKKLFGNTYNDVYKSLRDRKTNLKDKSKKVTAALDEAFQLYKDANFVEGKSDAEYSKEFNKAINDNEAETEEVATGKFMLDDARNELNQREDTYNRMLTSEGKDMFKEQKKKAEEELKAKMDAARKTEADIKAKEESKKKAEAKKAKPTEPAPKEPTAKAEEFVADPFAGYKAEEEVEGGEETPAVEGVAELFGKPTEEKEEVKEEPLVKDVQSEVNTGLVNTLDQLEDGEFYGKGQGETLPARIESLQKFANNPEGESGGLVATDGNTILFENNKLVMATTAIAYGTSKDFEEYNINNTNRTRTISNKLSEELTSNVVLSKTNTLPGDKVTIKVLSSLDFKPYTLSKDWTALDVDGSPIKTYPKGTLIDYNILSSLGNNYVPIGIFNASNELIGYLHDMSYMRDERVVSPETDRAALNMFRDYIIRNGGEVISNIETTSLGTLSINLEYTENSPIQRINGSTNRVSSEAIPTLELAVAKTETTAFTEDNENSLVTGTKNNFTNSPLIPGAIYAIAEGKGGQKLLCPIDTMQLGDIKEVADTLYRIITAYYKANKTAEDIEVLTKLFGQSYRGKDIENFVRLFLKSKDLTKVVDPRTNMITTEFEEDRYYFDIRPEGNEIQFGKTGTKVFSLNTNQKTEATKSIKQLLYTALENSYVSISLARKTEFSNKPVSYNLLDAEGNVIRKSHSNYNDFIKSYTFTNLNEYQINYKKDGKQVTESVIFDNPVISINPIVANKPKEVVAKVEEAKPVVSKTEVKTKPEKTKRGVKGFDKIKKKSKEGLDLSLRPLTEDELAKVNQSKAGLFNPGKIDIYQQTEVLNYLVATVANDITVNGSTFEESITNIKDMFEYYQEDNSDITPILEVWEKFSDNTKTKVEALSKLTDEDFFSESEEETRSSDDTNNTKVTENYSEDKWFTVDPNKSISGRLRRLLISIQDGENYLGLPKYKPVAEVMSKLQSILVNAPSADYNYFISKLREHQATNTWISNVVDILEGTDIYNKENYTDSTGLYNAKDHKAAIERFEDTKTQLQNEFAIWAYKHFVEKYTNVISRNKNNNQVTIKTISANQNDNVKMVVSSWIENLKLTDLITTNDKGNLIIDANKKKVILDKFKSITEDLKEKKYSPTSVKFQAELSELLDYVGINLDSKLLEKLTEALNSGTLNKKYTLANFTEAGGIFKTMFDKLASNKIATDAFEVIEDEETQMDETFNVSNPLTGNSGVNTLARWVATQVDDIISNSFYDNGKTIWSYSVNKHISSQIYKLKNDKNFVEFLRSCDFQSGSYILDMLSDATEGIAGKDLFKQWFKMAYVSSIKKSKSNAKELEYMEEPELEKTRLAFFMNQGDKDVKTGLRKVRHVSLTTSDKKNLAVFNMLAFTPNLTFDTTTGKFTGFNQETVQELINLIQGEYTRIYNYQNTIKADPSIKGNLADDFVKGAEIFYLFPILNDKTNNIIWDANGNLNRFDSKVSEEVGKILSREATKLVEDKIATWRNLGIDNFLDSTYIKKIVNPSLPDALKNNKEAMLAFAAADYELNQVRNNLNLYQLFSGDIAYYYKKESTTDSNDTIGIVKDTLTNLGKRLAAQIAPGNSLGNTNTVDVAGVNGHEYIQVIAKDQEVVSNNIKYLKTILDKTGVRPYESVEPTDAQEYTTLKEHLYVMFHEGKIPDNVYKDIMKRLETEGDNIVLDSKELGFVLQPVKPVYFDTKQSTYSSSTTNNKTNTLRPVYVKTSSIPLIPQFTKGLDVDKLRKSMEDLQKSENKLVRLVFKSGIKVGKPANITSVFTGEDKRSIKDNIKFSPDNYLVLNRDGFRIQQEVPFDADKAKINRGSQEVKIIFTDILDVKGFNYGELKNVDGRTLQKEYKAKIARLYKIGQEKLLDELDAKKDADGKVVSYNKEKLVELLKEEIKARGLSPDYYDALKLVDVGVDKVFTTPLMFLNRSNKFESLVISLVDNRARKQKNPGWSSPLVSSAGIMTLAEAKEGDFNENSVVLLDGFDLSQGLKSMRVEDGKVMPAQILAPFKFRDNKGNLLRIKDFTKVVDGKVVLDTDKLPRELLQSYGFRIPTSLQMSLSHMEIVGFLPESMGDSLIAPEDFTKQMGSDFDIDKLYAYLYNTIYNKKTGKLAKYTPTNVREAKYDSYLAKARKRGDSTIIPKDEFDTTFDEVKLLQNDLLDMRLAVLDNPSSEVQSKIHAAIGFDELKATANRIQKIKDSKVGAELVTPLSSEYQNKKYLNGRGGKAGTGVFSSSNTFNSLLQTVSEKMTYNKVMVVKTATGFRKVWVPTNIIFTESKGTPLNDPRTSDGNSKGAIHSAFQNASVDNEKEAILEKINVNRHTFSAIVGLIQDGHDENIIAYLINQPIVLDYVNELAKYQDATADERIDNPEAAAFNFIKDKYFVNVDAGIMEMYSNHEQPISMNDMVKSLELEAGYDRFAITQINAFAKFSQANDMGRTLQGIASTLNTDSAGLGKDFFSLYTKKGKLEKLVDTEKLPQVSNKELLMDSINGYASEAVDLTLDLFGSLFPVNNQAFNSIWSNFREDNQKVEDMDSDTQAAVVSNIFENFKSFIVATEFNKLLAENNSSLEDERQRLLVDTNTNKSFATITKIYQSRIKNPIVIRLSTKIVKDGKGISQVFFDASKGERLDESEMYQAYIDMLNSDNVITEINGQPYTEKDYARDLATYYFVTGGVFNPKSFGKFIANNYIEAIGLSENLRTVNFENEVYFADFYRQYMQNNPYRATKLTSDNDIIVKASILKSGNTVVGFKTTDFSGKYIMLDDTNLYEFNDELDYYNLIPQLGSQFASEYYPTRFVENTNKTVVNLSTYPENKLPIELTKPIPTTSTEGIAGVKLLEEINTVVKPIEAPVTGQSGLDTRTEAEKAREVKSINNKIVASTTTLDSLGFEKSMDNIDLSVALLNLYKDTSLSESNRTVALLLNRALEGNNVKFKFEPLGAGAEVGKYDHTTNTVTINSDATVSKGDMLENILHELTHSVTSRAIKSVLGKLKTPYEYTTAQKAAVLNLEKLYDYTRELVLSGKLEQFGYSAEELKNFEAEVAKKIADKSYNPKYDTATFDKYYGISMFANREKKVEEFVAMAMSNKGFQIVLNSVQAPKSDMSLMDKFIEQIKKIVEGFLTSFKITLDTGEKVDLNKDNLLFESLKNIVVLSMDSKENYMETTDIGSLFGAGSSPFGEYEAADEDIDTISDEEADDYKLNC